MTFGDEGNIWRPGIEAGDQGCEKRGETSVAMVMSPLLHLVWWWAKGMINTALVYTDTQS